MSLNWFISKSKDMAKKAVKRVVKKARPSVQKTHKVALFYADKGKVERAEVLVSQKKFKTLKDAYLSIGGLLTEGHGYKEV